MVGKGGFNSLHSTLAMGVASASADKNITFADALVRCRLRAQVGDAAV